MAIDYKKLLRLLAVRNKISKNKLTEYREDQEALSIDVADGETVLTLGWDGDFPGNSGAIWISRWNGFWFCSASDYDSEGPFKTMDEALSLGWFQTTTANPELNSDSLSLDELLAIGRGVVTEGDEIWINGRRCALRAGELVDGRIECLWSMENRPPAVQRYFSAHPTAFNIEDIESRYPYKGPASKFFREIRGSELNDGLRRIEGQGCWRPLVDGRFNSLTADLLAAGERLGGQLESQPTSGAVQRNIWMKLFDGGIGVEFQVDLNGLVTGRSTIICGARAYRALLELLGFNWIPRKLTGETEKPSHIEIQQLVDDLISQPVPL